MYDWGRCTHLQVAEQLVEDEEHLQRADHFESAYNFRYQASIDPHFSLEQ